MSQSNRQKVSECILRVPFVDNDDLKYSEIFIKTVALITQNSIKL